MTVSVPSFSRDDKSADVAAALREEGVAIVREVVTPEVIDSLSRIVEKDLAKQDPQDQGGESFVGGRTKALTGVFARGREFSEHLLLNPMLLEVADAILLPQSPMAQSATESQSKAGWSDTYANLLRSRDPHVGPNCHHYRVNAAAVGQVWGGGLAQTLHREMDIYRPFVDHDPDQPEYVLASNWAGTDFTLENGATRVVPGSHRWPAEREAEEHEVAQAVMPKGSVVFWLGRTLHGLGASRSDVPRTGFILTLVVDWLAAEENQYLSVPPELARNLPERAQQLLGYRSSPTIGWVSGLSGENLLVQGEGSPLD